MARARFHPLAERELVAAAQYYEVKNPGLGTQFLNAAERCERTVVEYPLAGSVVRGEVRRCHFRGFPYAFLYSVKPQGVRILAVMHHRRRPMY